MNPSTARLTHALPASGRSLHRSADGEERGTHASSEAQLNRARFGQARLAKGPCEQQSLTPIELARLRPTWERPSRGVELVTPPELAQREAPLSELTSDLVARAVRSDARAVRLLVTRLTPVVQSRVARVLLRGGFSRARGGDIRRDVEDLTQDAFEKLFAQGGRVLSSWDPERGLSLEAFVGLVAERSALTMLRSRPKNATYEAPTEAAVLELQMGGSEGPEPAVAATQLTQVLVRRLEASLSPLGFQVFRGLFCEEKSVDVVASELNLSAEALYMWRYRIRKAVLELTAELSGAGEARVAP